MSVPSPASTSSRRRWTLGLLCGALAFGSLPRIDAVSRFHPADRDQRTDVRRYYVSMAEAASTGRGWLPSYPTNFIPPPGQALFIYVLKAVWPSADFQHLRTVQALVSVLTIALGFAIGWQLSGTACGLVCAWLLAIDYRLSEWVGTLLAETNYVFCLFAATACLLAALRKPRRDLFLLTGVLIGAAALFKPTPTLLAPALGLVVALRLRGRRGWASAAWLVVGSCLVMAPWIVRNWAHYGHLLPISTNGGTLLALANAPELDASRPDMTYWDDLYQSSYYRDAQIDARFAEMRDRDGKPEENLKDRAYMRRASRYIAGHPGHFLRNYAYKIRNFILLPGAPETTATPFPFRRSRAMERATTVLGLVGLVALLVARRETGGGWAIVSIALYFLLFGALYHLTRDGRMNHFWNVFLSVPAAFVMVKGGDVVRRLLPTPSERAPS